LARRFSAVLQRAPEWLAHDDRIRRMQRIASESDEARRFTSILAVFSPEEAVQLVRHPIDAEALVAPVRRAVPHEDGPDTLNRLLRADARLSLADDLLTVADHMSMAHSVELRVPFLDLEYFGLIEQMPSRYKVSAIGSRKWLYRHAVAGLLPPPVRRSLAGPAARLGRKLGFTTPIDRWFAEWLERDAGAYLTGPGAHLPDHLDSATMSKVITSARAGAPRSRQLSALFVLESWLRGSGAAGATAA
jgi:asparagine synthase (glutamine-hydrolysing)